jgi:recombination protein RecT
MSATAITNATPKAPTLVEMLDKVRPQVMLALPKGFDAGRMIRTVLTAVQKTPKLMQCTPQSIVLAVLQAAQLGLDVDGFLGHAYLVPYWNKKSGKNEAQLQVGYRGFIALARRSGEISAISAEIVYSEDSFSVSLGTDRKVTHLPAPGDRGEAIGAYAVVFYKDGFKDFEWMTKNQIEHVRKSSKAADDGPWVTHWEEMARKSPIRRLAKRLPLSAEDSALIRAAVLDEYHEASDVDDPPAGIIELEPESPLLTNGNVPDGQYAEVAAPKETEGRIPASSEVIFFHVGKMLTTLTGATPRLSLTEYKNLGGRRYETIKGWTIPGSLTENFLKLCESKKIPVSEIDDNGQPMAAPFMATNDDLPGMFSGQ